MKLLRSFQLTALLAIPFFTLGALLRIFLIIQTIEHSELEWQFVQPNIFYYGLINDAVTFCYFSSIILFCGLFINLKNTTIPYVLYYLWLLLLVFSFAAECIFWDEFGNRFNFIAVDYLIYTKEVIGNIVQSYNLFLIFGIIFISCALLLALMKPLIRKTLSYNISNKYKLLQSVMFFSISVLCFVYFKGTPALSNHYSVQLSKNGVYELFSAFRNNELEYQKFYPSLPIADAFKVLQKDLGISDKKPQSIARIIKETKAFNDYNVMLITVESLSAEFLTQANLTPYLNELAEGSLTFSKYYATGNRTVRGIESSMLSIPPTQGNSIVRRKNNDNLFSIASVLQPHNYDFKFIYGGYGYFDNMNKFFSGNGFKIIDRNAVKKVTFANIWGVCDEDLYQQALKEADESFANKRAFFSFILTTSNHRPYTYPAGKIDMQSGVNRAGAVKYTDYAIGQFIKHARTKPWFNKTIFIITADHCASSAGKTAIPINKYHIPLIIYAPSIIKPKVIDKLASQIDLAPTILGLLNASYESRFFGENILTSNKERAFMGTYQKLGYLERQNFAVMAPYENPAFYTIENNQQIEANFNQIMYDKIVSYYQIADYLFSHNLLKNQP
jgi:phosphoglycerol transferase MdoB-like AlkP superfamily enzyme